MKLKKKVKVVLLQTIHRLGPLGAIVEVTRGFARNFLIPQKKAVSATEANIAEVEARRAELEKAEADVLAIAQNRAKPMQDLVLQLVRKAREGGKLFGSVGVRDIVDALTEKGIEVEKKEIDLPEGSIHTTGESEVHIRLHPQLIVAVKVIVEGEKSGSDEEEIVEVVENDEESAESEEE